jgi:bacillolysin
MGLKNDTDIWRLFEDTYLTPGKALRYMCDPAKDEISRDYYPDRCDYGGVHWNSGIVNLGECM